MSERRFADEAPPALGVHPGFSTAAGHPVTISVNVRNDADLARDVTVAVLGVDPSWVTGEARINGLAPGATETVRLELTPAVGTFPAQYPLVISAQALDPRTGTPTATAGMAEVRLTVNPRTQLSMQLDPAEISLVYRRRFGLLLRNSGASPARVRLDLQASHDIVVHLSPAVVDVLPGETLRVGGSVRARKPRLFGWVGQHQFSVTAAGSESVKHVEGTVEQRPLTPAWGARLIAIGTVLALWAGVAMFYLPELGSWIRENAIRSEQLRGPAPKVDAQDGSGDSGSGSSGSGDSGSGDGSGGSGTSGGSGGGSGGTQAQNISTSNRRLQLTGTVAADQPSGVLVRLEPTSLVNEEAQGATPIGVPTSVLDGTGMRLMSAFSRVRSARPEPPRQAISTSDGTWAFAAVRSPGYYLLTFSKPGFQTRKYIVDSSSEIAKEPLEVDMVPGEGRLSGSITGPSGPVGGATVTISDGTHTVTTNSNSRGRVGEWSIEGLSTPSSYVVQASKHDLSSEARLVELSPGGSATADLRLAAGVATMTGVISYARPDDTEVPLGGATVTVSDSKGEVRSATTVTEGRQIGFYSLPGLPAPGTYAVTVSADGYQSQTKQLTIERGQAREVHKAVLTSGSGTLAGLVTNADKEGLEGAGMTLTNAENTYKTTSTSDPAGGFSFTGVAPGSYTLTTRFFGLVTDHVTVQVRAGRLTPVNRVLGTVDGGVLPTSSKIVGKVVDFTTGSEVRPCLPTHPDAPRCLTASVVDSAPEDGTGTAPATTPFETRFEPSEQYTLPDSGETGLRPGLHTVRVTAPGYEAAEIDVEVPRDSVVNAPDVRLHPVPRIQGSVTTRAGSPTSPSCVWVVPGTSAPSALPECSAAIAAGTTNSPDVSAADKCLPARSTYEGTEPDLARMCAATGPAGDYQVEVPSSGAYVVQVVPSDPEYAVPAPITVNPARSSTVIQDVVMDRYGRVLLQVKVPGPTNALVPSVGTTVVVNPAPVLSHGLTNPSGEVLVRGLQPGVHTFEASDPDNPRQRGSVSLSIGFNDDFPQLLKLTDPVPYVVGRVLSHVFAPNEVREDAAVRVLIPTGYNADGSAAVIGQVDMTTQARGCFAIQSAAMPPQDTPQCGTLVSPALEEREVASTRANEVRVTADHYETLTETMVAFNGVRDFSLIPARVAFTGSIALDQGAGAETAPDWDSVSVEVLEKPAETGTIQIGTTNRTNTGATLTWTDSAGGTPTSLVRPGTYRVRASMAGYASVESTLRCEVGTGGCAFTPALTLKKQGSVRLGVVDTAGAPVNGTAVKNLWNQAELNTGADNLVTFDDVDPGASVDFEVRAAGHRFGTTADDLEMTCRTAGSTTDLDEVVVEPGAMTTCEVVVERLGTISGVLQGVDVTLNTSALTGKTITATRCTDADCTTTAEALSALTNTDGEFSITGTTVVEGLTTGRWLVSVSDMAGYESSERVIVELTDAEPDASGVVIKVHRLPVDVVVKVKLPTGEWVADAEVAISYRGITAPAPDPERTDSGGEAAFTGVVPVTIDITVSGTGLVTTTEPGFFTDPLPVGGPVEFEVVVSRETGTLQGRVTDSGDGTGINGVTVSVLDCDPDPAVPCDPDAVVVGTDNQPLTTTTATRAGTAGAYSFSTVPPGSYVLSFTLDGYSSQSPGAVTATVGLEVPTTINHVMVANRRTGTLRLSTNNALEDLGATDLRLVPVAGTPGDELSYNFTGANPTWTATMTGVRWGCYRVEVDLPDGHHGAVGQLTGSPSDPRLACPAGSLVVPQGFSTEEFEVGIAVSSSLLQISTTVTAYPGRAVPTATHQVSGPYTGSVVAPSGGTVELFVPPGTYSVKPTLSAEATPLFWNLAEQERTGVDLDPGEIAPLSFALAEKTVPVTITFADLPALEVPFIQIDPEPGQGWYAPSPLPDFDVADQEMTVLLPQGTWLIRADYSAGPAGDAITISSLTARTVTLQGTP